MDHKKDGTVEPGGVFRRDEKSARIYAEIHDKDVIPADGGWLAKDKPTESGRMPTRRGDVVVRHVNQRYDVWLVLEDGAQDPDPNVEVRQVWSLAEVEQAVRDLTDGTNAQIFRLQKDKHWSILSS